MILEKRQRQQWFSPPILAEQPQRCTRCRTISSGLLTGRLLQFSPNWHEMPQLERRSNTRVRLNSADVRSDSRVHNHATEVRTVCLDRGVGDDIVERCARIRPNLETVCANESQCCITRRA